MVGGYNKILLAFPSVEEKSFLYMFIINIADRQFPWHPTQELTLTSLY
jgi:hypothetical protein